MIEEKRRLEQKHMVEEAIDKMRFLKKNFKQLKSMEKQVNENQLPHLYQNENGTETGPNQISYGGSNAQEDYNEDESEKYDEILPMKMKSYHPEINDAGSFAKDIMPPLSQVRQSIGSHQSNSMSQSNRIHTQPPQ